MQTPLGLENKLREESEDDPEPSENESQQFLTISDAMFFGYPGIVSAGAVYPILNITVWCLVVCVVELVSGNIGFENIWEGIGLLMTFVAISVIVGIMIAGLTGVIVMAVIGLFNRSLGFIWRPLTAASIAGGLTGFLSTCAAPIVMLYEGGVVELFWAYLLGPIVAMCLGQIGAARYMSYGVMEHYRLREIKVPRVSREIPRSNFRKFEIKQILILMAWLSLPFAGMGAVSSEALPVAIVLSSYFVLQPICYLGCAPFGKSYSKKQFALILSSKS